MTTRKNGLKYTKLSDAMINRKSFRSKLLSTLVGANLIWQQFLLMVVPFLPAPAFALEETVVEQEPISFDNASNSFTFPVADNQAVDYLLAYRTDADQTEAVMGVEQPIYAGTCSEDGNCVDHEVLHGILKTQVENVSEVGVIRFALDNDQVVIVSQETAVSQELSEDENTWLENYSYQPAVSPSPTLIPSPSPEAETVLGDQTDELNPSPSPALTETDSSPPTLDATTIVLDGSLLPEFDLDSQEESSATLTTDKPDYAPTETVVISGSGFEANTGYTIIVSSTDEPAVTHTDSVTADDQGNFVYTYQLDGTYRPNYLVEAFLAETFITSTTLVASTSFTDSDTTFKSPAAEGGNHNLWTNGQNAFVSDDVYATHTSEAQAQSYENFGFSVPAGATIDGIEVKVEAKSTDITECQIETNLWSVSDNEHTNTKTQALIGSDVISTLGTPTDLWGSTWTADDFTNANFHAEVKFDDASGNNCGATTVSLDNIQVKVYYTESTPSGVQTEISQCVEDAFGSNTTCTANDVSIANVTNIDILDDGCQFPGDTVTFAATWDVQSTATQRYNVGLYFASEGQASAENGTCSVSTLANSPVPPNYNYDGNACGDISSASVVQPQITMTVQCLDTDEDNLLNLPYCTSWNQNVGENLSCSGPSDAIPGSPSKCNCQDGFQVPITVPFFADIEVIKQLEPAEDSGTFNLEVDGTDEASCVSDGGTTDQVAVEAGTSESPGATHTVGENVTGCGSTDLNDYDSSISCVDRNTTTFNGGVPLTQGGTGPLNVAVDEDDDIVCTITNTLSSGHIIVNKLTVGGDSTFDFTTTGSGYSGFSLSNGGSNDQEVTPGAYTVSETDKTGWSSDGGVCDQGETPGSLDVGPGETVTCTFTNTELGSVSGYKYDDNDGVLGTTNDRTILEGWLMSLYVWDDGISDWLDTGETDTTDVTGFYEFANLLPGLYQILETLQPGWTNLSSLTQNVDLSAGETSLDNDFVNTQYGTITVYKQTIPSGSLENFEFDSDYHNENFLLQDTYFDLSGYLLPGTYSVTELDEAGWDLTSATCDDDSDPSSISLQSGETVTCTFTNTQNGHIIVDKVTDPAGSVQSFNFDATGGSYSDFSLTDLAAPNDQALVPGTYSVSETEPFGWDLTNTTCVSSIQDTETAGSLELDAGETITCTFTNTELGNVTVIKYNDHNGNGVKDDGDEVLGDTGDGEEIEATRWEIHLDGEGVDSDQWTGAQVAGQVTFSDLLPNSFTLNEQIKSGWVQTNIACEGDQGIDNDNSYEFSLAAGQDATCFIGNQGQGAITVHKLVDSDGNGSFEGGNDEANNLGFDWWLDAEAQLRIMGSTATGVSTGAHTVTEEEDATGYHFVGWFPGNPNSTQYSCANLPEGAQTTTADITVSTGQTNEVTFCNARDTGDIVITKLIDADGSLGTTDDRTPGEGWQMDVDPDGQDTSDPTLGLTDASGETSANGIKTGTYWVNEDANGPTDNYLFLDSYCTLNEEPTGNSGSSSFGGVEVATDQTTYCTFINTEYASITVYKNLDTNGDGDLDDAEIDVIQAPGWTWDINGSGDYSASAGENTVGNILPGTHTVSEDQQAGYHVTTFVCGETNYGAVESQEVTLNSGDDLVCTFTNTRDTGTIIVHKIIDPDGNLEDDSDQFPGEGWEMDVDGQEGDTSDPSAQNTDSNGETTFADLKTGDYNVDETLQPGYDLLDAYCDEGENGSPDGETIFSVGVGTDETVECTFINSPNGSIHGQKWNDLNGDGIRDFDEQVLGGWRIFLDENDNQTWDDGEQNMFTDNDQELGWYWFEHLFPGTYTVCEEVQPGWAQTSSPTCHVVEIPNENACPGPELQNRAFGSTCDFGNKLDNPILTITKTNNAAGDKAPGDSVLFTLTITATQSAATNVVLTDLPAGGFTYQPGTWTFSSNLNPGLVVGEPVYASPGKWNLGDMQEGETITLTYLAQISGSQAPGLYTDLAWANGESLGGTDVLAMAENPGFVDTNFVGTQVNIVTNDQDSLALGGQVLGASTQLPATGAQVLWSLIALALITSGLTGLSLARRLKK